jgi:hypothetical protein
VAVAVIWTSATGRWSRTAWAAPGAISGDVVEIAARIQVAHENWSTPWNLFGHIERLGAPVGADWSGYPVSDRLEFWVAGLLMPLVGPFGTINWLMLFGYAAGAISFYLCARVLRWRVPWAFSGALVFAFANFNFRWSPSLSLGLTFTLPPACLLFQWIARGAPVARAGPWRMLAVGLGLAIGAGSPYFAFMAGQLGLLASLLQLRRGAHRARLQAAAWFLAALTAGFVLTTGPYFLSRLSDERGAESIVDRKSVV